MHRDAIVLGHKGADLRASLEIKSPSKSPAALQRRGLGLSTWIQQDTIPSRQITHSPTMPTWSMCVARCAVRGDSNAYLLASAIRQLGKTRSSLVVGETFAPDPALASRLLQSLFVHLTAAIDAMRESLYRAA